MTGNEVYIIMRREALSGRETILSLHATFDGAYEVMEIRRDYWLSKGYTIKGDLDYFQVLECGRLVKCYWVLTRTMEE